MKAVHYLNQFFGQIGGEAQANTGFMVKDGLVGPGMPLQKELGENAGIVATVICGDDYFATDPEKHAEEGLKLVSAYRPDLFFAGPAFAAGRYGIACGAMCKIIGEKLGIPAVTGMHEESPGVDIYRKDTFICKTPNNARKLQEAVRDMARLSARLVSAERETRLLSGENLPQPEEYNYYSRNLLRNEYSDKSIAERSVEKLLAKIQGKPFESEIIPPRFEKVPPAPAVRDINRCEIALVSDGGLVPKGNPNKFTGNSNVSWGAYELEAIFREYDIVHAGYFHDHVLASPDRLVPFDVMRDLEKEGKIGKLHPILYSTTGCSGIAKRCAEMGKEIGEKIKQNGPVGAVILTST